MAMPTTNLTFNFPRSQIDHEFLHPKWLKMKMKKGLEECAVDLKNDTRRCYLFIEITNIYYVFEGDFQNNKLIY